MRLLVAGGLVEEAGGLDQLRAGVLKRAAGARIVGGRIVEGAAPEVFGDRRAVLAVAAEVEPGPVEHVAFPKGFDEVFGGVRVDLVEQLVVGMVVLELVVIAFEPGGDVACAQVDEAVAAPVEQAVGVLVAVEHAASRLDGGLLVFRFIREFAQADKHAHEHLLVGEVGNRPRLAARGPTRWARVCRRASRRRTAACRGTGLRPAARTVSAKVTTACNRTLSASAGDWAADRPASGDNRQKATTRAMKRRLNRVRASMTSGLPKLRGQSGGDTAT